MPELFVTVIIYVVDKDTKNFSKASGKILNAGKQIQHDVYPYAIWIYEMLFSGKFSEHSFDLFTRDVMQIAHTNENEFVDIKPHINVILAA